MRHLHRYIELSSDFKQLAFGIEHLVRVRADMRGDEPSIVPAWRRRLKQLLLVKAGNIAYPV